jgi:hypothetical protein
MTLLVRVLFAPVALVLGALPAKLFVPPEAPEDDVTILEGTARVEWL